VKNVCYNLSLSIYIYEIIIGYLLYEFGIIIGYKEYFIIQPTRNREQSI